MKKTAILASLFLLLSTSAFAGPYDEFNNVLDKTKISKSRAQRYLDALASDVGQAISAGSYGIGASLGFLGLYASLKASYQKISSDDVIIDEAGYSGLIYPILHVEVGLPYRFDLIARGSYLYGSTLLGGGLRWEAIQSKNLIIPSVSIQSVYSSLQVNTDGNKFNLWNLKTGVSAGFNQIPIVKPFVFASYDHTNLEAKSSDYEGLSSNLNGFGYGIGASLSLAFFNFSVSVSMYDETPNYNLNIFIGL